MESSPLDLAVPKAVSDTYSVFIVCDLDPRYLSSTLDFLNSFSSEKSLSKTFSTVSIEEFLSWRLDFNPSAEVLCLHLSLDNEIKNHKLISDHVFKLRLKQLNPYNSFSDLFDNKFLFYYFMLAQGFKQAKTYFIKKDESLTELSATLQALGSGLKLDYHPSPSICFVLKPCFGTESIDQYSFNLEDIILKAPEFLEKIALIHQYDSVLIQEKLNFKEEYKIIFLEGYLFSAKALSENLLVLCQEFLKALEDYAKLMRESLNRFFSIDVLELFNGELVVLETNSRPAGIYKCINFSYLLKDRDR